MENKDLYKEQRFDSFLNKTIMMSSRKYFTKQMNIIDKENTILDNEDYCAFLQRKLRYFFIIFINALDKRKT